MLLRIDVYPFSPEATAATATAATSLTTPSQTLHACLATTPSDRPGQLLTVGRKVGNVLLSNDKSVSRDHCTLRLVSANKTHQSMETKTKHTKNTAASSSHGTCVSPSNNEQTEACRQANQHMCVVLETTGKLGCFVVQERDEKRKIDETAKPKDDDDEDTTDDEEVHESSLMAASQGQHTALSPIAQELVKNPTTAELKLVGQGQTHVLSDLSKPDGRVIVQCGKLGSTLVIQRETIRFMKSKNDRSKSGFMAGDNVHIIGAELVVDMDQATHYITRARSASPNQLAAWCKDIPIVTPDFLQALLDRNNPADAMPSPSDNEPRSDGLDFWYQRPLQRLWKSWTFVSLTHDEDMEGMVQAAGATVVPLHDLPSVDDRVLKVQETMRNPNTRCFSTTTTSKKLMKELKAMPGLLLTSRKHLAQYLTQQKMPDGSDPPPETLNEAKKKKDAAEATIVDDTTATKQQDVVSEEKTADDGRNKKSRPAESDSREGAKEAVEETTAKPDDDKSEAPRTGKKRAASPTKVNQEDYKHREQPVKRSKVEPKSRKSAASPPPAQDNEEEEKSEDHDDDHSRKRSRRTQENPPTVELREENDDDDDEQDRPMKRKQLETNKSGWLVAAPKAKKQRKAYRRTTAEIQDSTGDDDAVVGAPTFRCKGLVVSVDGQSNNKSSTSSSRSSKTKTSAGPNFKTFRKNVVAQPVQARIHFRSVLPKESEQQRELAELRQEVEEQQRRADELFHDPIAAQAHRRRRRRN